MKPSQIGNSDRRATTIKTIPSKFERRIEEQTIHSAGPIVETRRFQGERQGKSTREMGVPELVKKRSTARGAKGRKFLPVRRKQVLLPVLPASRRRRGRKNRNGPPYLQLIRGTEEARFTRASRARERSGFARAT